MKRGTLEIESRSLHGASSTLSNGGILESQVQIARSVLRWAGSKRQILPKLSQYWSAAFERYVEPFCGSSALFFLLNPEKALLSDSNTELIGFYDVLRENPAKLWADTIAIARTQAMYLKIRAMKLNGASAHTRAVRFLYLNRNCFNGLYRTNAAGNFNVPFASSRAGEMPSLAEFVDAAGRLQRAQTRACDFGHTLRDVRAGDFVYLDPPFFVSARRVFRDYGPRKFVQTDIDRLGKHLDRLDARGAAFVLSFADCAEVRPLARHWDSRRVKVQRQIAGFASDRRFAYERLISNTAPA